MAATLTTTLEIPMSEVYKILKDKYKVSGNAETIMETKYREGGDPRDDNSYQVATGVKITSTRKS